jgi:hypothetical protein
MSYQSTADRGNYLGMCDDCGRKFKASELRKRWDQARVCRTCFEERPLQDFVKGAKDILPIPWSQPEPIDSFSLSVYDLPWNAGGLTISQSGNISGIVALSDYIIIGGASGSGGASGIVPTTPSTIIFNIPLGTTITGTITPGTIPSGSTIIVNNGGAVTKNPQPNFPSKGIPPIYHLQWNGGQYPSPVLYFNVQPSDTGMSANITPAVEVWVVGNLTLPITDVVFNIMMTIENNPGSPPGVLSGTLTQTTMSGVATFNDLQIDQAGDGYILIASVV